MIKILIVEDDPNMRIGLNDNLEFEGYETETAEDGEIGLNKLLNNRYDLIILDIMMPKISGLDVCKKAREKGVTTPIIMLTAKGEEVDKVVGLEIGADDYVTKPFSIRELLARIKAILRRSSTGSADRTKEEGTVKIGRMEIDLDSYTAGINGREIQMSYKEFEIIKFLIHHKNETVSRDSLLKEIWGENVYTTARTIDNFISRLRHKVEEDPNNPKIILTVHGIGYKLIK